MLEAQERKTRFVLLLKELLDQCEGIKGKLAQNLNIKPSTLTPWLQGKIDPASLDITAFLTLARLKEISVNELAILLGIKVNQLEDSIENKFKNLVEQLLFNKSQQELAERLGVSRNAISSWITPQRNIDPANINIATMIAIAIEKGWTIERLLIHLGLKEPENEKDLRFKLKTITTTISLAEQIELLAWISNLVNKTAKDQPFLLENTKYKSNLTILVILEQDDVAIASNYFSNLVEYLKFQAKNIKIATIPKLPQSLADIDILIFDINTTDSPSIQLIEDLTFNGDIIIFADAIALPLIRDKISSAVSEIFVKPVDWSALQSFPYFQTR